MTDMKLNDLFEKVFVINLPFKIDRRAKLEKHLAEVGIVDTGTLVWERAICGDWTPAPSWWGGGNGAWGCLMSHVRIAQDAVHDSLASYCVLEDDVVFHPNASFILERFAKELPADWGQIYLGGQHLHREPDTISPWVQRPFNVNRTHAFGLSKRTIPKFLQHILHAPDYFNPVVGVNGNVRYESNFHHIDHQLGKAHERRDWNVYSPTWWIAGQEEGNSNISGKVNQRLWWHWRDKGHLLPFLYLDSSTTADVRESARPYLHCGYNTYDNSHVDVALTRKPNDDELREFLYTIAGEAVERWRLPGFEIPPGNEDLLSRIKGMWEPGVHPVNLETLETLADYPFNGRCGGLPELR